MAGYGSNDSPVEFGGYGANDAPVADGVGAKPKKRSAFAVANDSVIEAANAFAGGVGAISSFVSPGNRFAKGVDSLIKSGEEKQSDATKEAKTEFRSELESADTLGGEVGAVGRYIKRNPLLAASQAAGSIAGPGVAIKGTQALSIAAGLSGKAATKIGQATGIGIGGAMGGGDAGQSAYDLVQATPAATLTANPEYSALAAQGKTDAEIRDILGTKAARNAMPIPTLLGLGAGAVGAERLIAGAGKAGSGRIARALGTGAIEGTTEGIEEGASNYLGRQAASEYDPSIDPIKGTAGAAAMGAALGAGIGGGIGALTPNDKQSGITQPPEDPAISGLLSAPINTGTPSDQTIAAAVERANAVAAAQANADALYKSRADYEASQQPIPQVNPATGEAFTPDEVSTFQREQSANQTTLARDLEIRRAMDTEAKAQLGIGALGRAAAAGIDSGAITAEQVIQPSTGVNNGATGPDSAVLAQESGQGRGGIGGQGIPDILDKPDGPGPGLDTNAGGTVPGVRGDLPAGSESGGSDAVTPATTDSRSPHWKNRASQAPQPADQATDSRSPLAGPVSISGKNPQVDNKPLATPGLQSIRPAVVDMVKQKTRYPDMASAYTLANRIMAGEIDPKPLHAKIFEKMAKKRLTEAGEAKTAIGRANATAAAGTLQNIADAVKSQIASGKATQQEMPVAEDTLTDAEQVSYDSAIDRANNTLGADAVNATLESIFRKHVGNDTAAMRAVTQQLEAQLDSNPRAAKTTKPKTSPYATKDPKEYAKAARGGLLKLLRKHGLSSNDAADLTGENAFNANQRNPGLFKGKTTLDESVIPALVAEGYMTQQQVDEDVTGGMGDAMDLIRAAFAGDRFVGTFDQRERLNELEQLAEEAEAELQGQEEQAIVNELVGMDLTDDEFNTLFSGVPVDDASDQRNADIQKEQENDAVKNAAIEAQAQKANARGAETGAQGSKGKDGTQGIQAADRTDLGIEASQSEVDRRHDPARRKSIADMTPDEMRRELLIDAMTGLGNRRAYEESTKLATQVSIDADGLKWINDNLGHESGDRLLETIGQVIADETTNGFHISGDEYVIQTHTKEEADAIMARVVERLNDVTITTDGDAITMRGIGISYGINGDLSNAEKALREHKAQREREGLRGGRGAIPPNAVIKKQGDQDNQNNDTAEEEIARPELNLTGQTQAEIAAAEAAEKKAAEKSARDDAKPTGPDVTADQVDLFNTQGGVLDRASRENDFVKSPDGSIDFGEINAGQAKAMRRQAGKIRLTSGVQNADGTGHGLAHIEANHGNQIRGAGFDSVPEFVSHVASNFNEILQASGKQLLVAVDGGRKDVMFVQLEPDSTGDFYRINTAFPASRDYLEKQQKKGMKLLWGGSEPASTVAGQQPLYAGKPDDNSGQDAPIAQGQSSESTIAPNADQGKATGITDTHIDLFKRVKQGDVSATEFKDSFDTLLNNKESVVADLSGMTKDAIFQRFPGIVYRHKNDKKADVIEAAYRDMVDDFTLGKGYSWGMSSGNSSEDAIRALVDATTDHTLADYANDVKTATEEREARGKVVAAGMDDPQTLEDFQRLIAARARDMGGNVTFQQVRMTLTPEQREQFDILAAEKSRKERGARKDSDQNSVSAAGATTGAEIVATKHTRDGYDLFVVKAAERVERDVYSQWLATAKKLGGWYSAFKGNGAIPGFQFKTRESAEAFQKYVSAGDTQAVQDQAKIRRDEFADDRSQTAIERLNEMAGSLEGKSDASLNRDRKQNTSRRARMAASAEASANSDKAMAQTMRNIAAAIEGGTAKLLDRVRQKVQVEMLRGFMHTAQSDKLRALYPSYAEQEKHKDEKPDAETADYVTFPTYTAFRSDLASLGRVLLEVDGTKKLGQRLMKVADDVSDAYLKFAKDNLDAVSVFRTKDGLRAAFPSKAMAEASIVRSEYKGAAIVLPVKRNQNQIILSPSEAIKRGVWEGDNDKRISLSAEFGAELVEKIGKAARSKISVPWQFENAYDKRRRLTGMGIETPAELRAAIREFIGLRAAPKEIDKIKVMERAMIGRRNDGLDFFPTPASVADEMVEAAGVQPEMSVLEPSAGMGHIAERIRDAGVDPDVVEMASDRRGLLEAKGFNLVGNDFMDMAEGQYDRIIMNPPFSDRRDAEHVQRAYELLKPGGRLVALMGEGVFFGKDKKAQSFRDWLEQVGATDEKLEEGTFMDASLPVNTGVNARMVVIDKPGPEWKPSDTKETDTGTAMFQPDGAYADPYQTIETRPNTTPKQLAVGREALNDAEKRIFGQNTAGFELLGSRVSADFRAQGGTSLIGQEVTRPDDLAFAAQVLRDPRFETFRVFYTDAAGKIIGERAYSSRLAGAVYLPDSMAEQVHIDMRVHGATGYWLQHNHPSGSATESRADLNLTANIANKTKGFLGHVVIDHNEYNHISVEGGIAVPNLVSASHLASINLNANPEKAHPLLGEAISGPSALAEIAKRMQTKDGYVVLIGTDGQQRISLITEVPASYLRGAQGSKLKGLRAVAAIKRATGETGSTNLFAAVPGDVMDFGILIDSGMLRDVVSMNGGASAANQGLLAWKGIPVSNVARSGGKGYVAQRDEALQSRVIAAQDLRDQVRETGQRLEIDAIGNIVLYHGTSRANAESIRSNGRFNDRTFFAPSAKATESHAKPKHGKETEVMRVIVDPRDVEFSTGSGEFYVPTDLVRGENGIWAAPSNPSIVEQPATPYREPIWSAPTPARMDTFLYEIQDKHIDTKRVIESIKTKINDLADEFNTYVKEALYHGRADKRTKDFLTDELTPLVDAMAKTEVTQTQLNEYLHARHAIERNRVMRERNPDREDNADLSGMSDDEANEILKKAPLKMVVLAKRVDAIVAKSRQALVEYGLETQETVDAWSKLYKHYVPLKREGFDDTAGTGSGFSVRGSSTKEAIGSHRAVDNIFANIAMQRERNLTRGEKNRVALSLYGLAKTNPNAGFWKLDKPAQITQINAETGLPEVVPGDMADYKVPMVSYIGKDGTVQMRVDPAYKGRDNVVTVRIKGTDHAIIFNESDPRALRMAESLKNLDMDQLGEVIGSVGRVTRYIAAVNTQYNPVFGVTNLLRDVQTAMLNLQSTPLKGKQRDVMKEAVGALKGIYQDARAVRRGEHPDSEFAKDWDEFQSVGGQTGYRDMFRTAKDRAAAIEHMLDPAWWQKTYAGKLLTLNGVLAKPEQMLFNAVGKHLFRWLEDYNTSMENAMRLAAYRVGKRNGMSQEAAAFLAKSLTVNFNKKGRVATQAGALYAFFNASAQGTARIAETLRHGAKPGERLGKTGKAIVGGGIMLGAMQALLLLAAGFDEDEPPEFVRERNLIIPAPGTDKGYITIPMPLGFHVLPNIGRVLVEGSVYGKPLDRMADLMLTLFEAFNPIGTGASLAQTISPTVADPIVALSENKDWTGKRIFREDFSQLDPTPGFTRTKDNASILAKGLAYGINAVTGGSDYTPGRFSPTPDQIDYLIGQATGGVGREVTKAATTAGALITGEELPTYKIPLVGRLIGSAGGESGVRDKFYDNLRTLNLHEAEIQGRRDKREPVLDYITEHPEARLAKYAGRIESKIREKKRLSKQAKEDGRDSRLIDAQIVNMMKQLNERVDGANP